MSSHTFASDLPRQSPSSLIFASMNAEPDSAGTGFFMSTSNTRTYFRAARGNLQTGKGPAGSVMAMGHSFSGSRPAKEAHNRYAAQENDGLRQKGAPSCLHVRRHR
jgi:hypothetical protein